MNKKILIFAFLPLLLVTSKVQAQTTQQYQIYNRQNTGSESSKPNFDQLKKTNSVMNRIDFRNNPKVQEFKSRISQISDSRKKKLAENIDTKITNLNTKSTTSMSGSLAKLTAVLSNIKTKQSTIATTGANLVPLNTAIASAETAITAAQTAVATQSQKQYTADITNASNSATLKSPFTQMLLQFRQDILNTRQTVLTAKESAVRAAVELNKLIGGPAPFASSNAAGFRR